MMHGFFFLKYFVLLCLELPKCFHLNFLVTVILATKKGAEEDAFFEVTSPNGIEFVTFDTGFSLLGRHESV